MVLLNNSNEGNAMKLNHGTNNGGTKLFLVGAIGMVTAFAWGLYSSGLLSLLK